MVFIVDFFYHYIIIHDIFIICLLNVFILVIWKESNWRMLWPNTVMILYILLILYFILIFILFNFFKCIFSFIYFHFII